MTPAELSRTVLRSVRGALEARELSLGESDVPVTVDVRVPPRPGCGDYATNVALRLAGPAGLPAREVAGVVRKRLAAAPGIAGVEIAGPGFLNITLAGGAPAAVVREVLEAGAAYGRRAGAVDGHPADADASADGHTAGRPAEGRTPRIDLRPAPGPRAAVVAETLRAIMEAVGEGTGSEGEEVRPVPVKDAAGRYATADGLVARLGVDEMRWVLLYPAAHDHVRVPERPVQREDNPRFLVQYAYARTCAVSRNARDLGVDAPAPDNPAGEPSGTGDPYDIPHTPLHAALAAYPAVLEAAARLRAPDRLARHLEATAEACLSFLATCPPLPVGEQKPMAVHRARLAVAQAAGTVLANGLTLLGISAPEHL
ncbi:ArgS-related anticodon-binding protein NrtL [Streptomyces ochraceiscleroticus]|uniref:arginine--tRNA ligase n=1 Tax=Streptomyces ochraceiscleroticus TaxID=47761 RepID=A0ABW1MDR7_9ACTN|nr:DALR anticodon-binding domain-containing protein [Streptomyces ochraceiscleroticus]